MWCITKCLNPTRGHIFCPSQRSQLHCAWRFSFWSKQFHTRRPRCVSSKCNCSHLCTHGCVPQNEVHWGTLWMQCYLWAGFNSFANDRNLVCNQRCSIFSPISKTNSSDWKMLHKVQTLWWRVTWIERFREASFSEISVCTAVIWLQKIGWDIK